MKSLEDDLRSVLRREEPPEGFAGRVLDRVKAGHGHQRTYRLVWGRPWFRWTAVAALAVILLAASLLEYQRRREGEAARSNAMLALRIASTELNSTLKKVVDLQPPHVQMREAGASE
jgi:hypothetical protein